MAYTVTVQTTFDNLRVALSVPTDPALDVVLAVLDGDDRCFSYRVDGTADATAPASFATVGVPRHRADDVLAVLYARGYVTLAQVAEAYQEAYQDVARGDTSLEDVVAGAWR